MSYNPTEQEKKIIEITQAEVSEWRDATVYVTNKTSYKMLGSDGIIQRCRKNYLGKFDNDFDTTTGKKKIFLPLTEDMVETVVKNIDLDAVDINIRATNPNGFSSALILRYLVNYFMRRNYFGEVLNDLLRRFCIDGTVVLKIIKDRNKISTPIPDLMNLYIEPSVEDIQSSGAFIERNILKLSEIRNYPWKNLEFVKGETFIERLSGTGKATNQVPYVEIYERWGDLPKSLITGRKEDENVWVPTVAIISNLFTNPVVHKVAINDSGIKPYEECHFRKIPGRWYGRGIGEILLGLQSYLNEIINLRLNRARLSQTGLWEIRKGSGITAQQLTSLVTGGAIFVNQTGGRDIAELRKSDVPPSSYRDEQQVYLWSQRATGAWEVSRGETLPASLPATTAVLQERATRGGYDLLQENLGIFLSKVFERHLIPLLIETMKEDEVVSIIGSPKELKEIDENFINQEINKHIINHMITKGFVPDVGFVEHLRRLYRENLRQFQKTRYLKINKRLLQSWKYEVEVFVTGEAFNKAVMVRQLNDLLLAYSRLPGVNLDVDAVIKEIFDLMGLGGARFLKSREEEATRTPIIQPNIPTPQSVRPLEETERVGELTTLERLGRGGIR